MLLGGSLLIRGNINIGSDDGCIRATAIKNVERNIYVKKCVSIEPAEKRKSQN